MDCENVYTVLEVQSIERSSNFEWLATAPEMKVAQALVRQFLWLCCGRHKQLLGFCRRQARACWDRFRAVEVPPCLVFALVYFTRARAASSSARAALSVLESE